MVDLVQLISMIIMWVLIGINLVMILPIKKVHSGNLILLEEEDEDNTYAFLELHEPIENIKGKKSIRLKIERRTR